MTATRLAHLYAVALLLSTAASASASYTFTTLDYPSASSTIPYGISGNTIVGNFQLQPSKGDQAFSWTDGVFTPLHAEAAHGISGNVIVGLSSFDGFVLDNGVYTKLDNPLATMGTVITGVAGSMTVGYYRDSIGFHGFTECGGVFTSLDDPLASLGTQIYAISGSTIVGAYLDGTFGIHGFMETNGVFTDITPTGGRSAVSGIDGDTLVGYYIVGSVLHGFIEKNGIYTTLDDPDGTTGTSLRGIFGTTIVGSYTNGDGTHGFVATLNVPEPASLLIFLPAALLLARRRNRSDDTTF